MATSDKEARAMALWLELKLNDSFRPGLFDDDKPCLYKKVDQSLELIVRARDVGGSFAWQTEMHYVLWNKCCETHRKEQSTAGDATRIGKDEILQQIDEMLGSLKHNAIFVSANSLEEAVATCKAIMHHLISAPNYDVFEFTLDIEGGKQMWLDNFPAFFDDKERASKLRCSPSLCLKQIRMLDMDEFFKCELFNLGLKSVIFHQVNEASGLMRMEDIDKPDPDPSIYHEILDSAPFVSIVGYNLQLDDDDLILLFGQTHCLTLKTCGNITQDGIAQLIQRIFENYECEKVEIRTRQNCKLEELLMRVPKESVSWTKGNKSAVMKNEQLDEKWTVRCTTNARNTECTVNIKKWAKAARRNH